jgi:hypothetical protein
MAANQFDLDDNADNCGKRSGLKYRAANNQKVFNGVEKLYGEGGGLHGSKSSKYRRRRAAVYG